MPVDVPVSHTDTPGQAKPTGITYVPVAPVAGVGEPEELRIPSRVMTVDEDFARTLDEMCGKNPLLLAFVYRALKKAPFSVPDGHVFNEIVGDDDWSAIDHRPVPPVGHPAELARVEPA